MVPSGVRTSGRYFYRMLGNGVGGNAGGISNLCKEDQAFAVYPVGNFGNGNWKRSWLPYIFLSEMGKIRRTKWLIQKNRNRKYMRNM